MKKCSRKDCPHNGKWQPTANFDKNVNKKDRLCPECKDCRKERGRKNVHRNSSGWTKMWIG